ncbi:hypothetical protein BOTBODRAFT_181646 [Botryobasidium botryosum FD-172 SS1]|uniref:Uncharacterized protein n=1 Tax=Botryobasidium botryosum (strain FD-172 SS1) TaxID=930990 RepID=A0A067LVT2_BOTB1|nr:hypothetical protein BOTBODRAFT_181646 [Botryobasidium botryosum FD-172 SS1]
MPHHYPTPSLLLRLHRPPCVYRVTIAVLALPFPPTAPLSSSSHIYRRRSVACLRHSHRVVMPATALLARIPTSRHRVPAVPLGHTIPCAPNRLTPYSRLLSPSCPPISFFC